MGFGRRKILWLSNYRFTEENGGGSGSWIDAMGKGLAVSGDFEICNITLGVTREISRHDACGITQWVVPISSVAHRAMDSLPPLAVVDGIRRLVGEISPDLIHVWGTERFWGLLTARKILDFPALLEMQGITSAMAPYMTGCLTQKEMKRCLGIKEILFPKLSMAARQHQFVESAVSEREMWVGHAFIDYQSDWVKSYVQPFAPSSRFFRTRMILRNEYLGCSPWRYRAGNHTVFTTCGWSANKGLHTLVRACGLLKRTYPDIILKVAGPIQQGLRRSGYVKWVMREIAHQGVDVRVLGAISPSQVVRELQDAAVYVNPSLVESYSMSLAEGMAVGCPCVASYAGAMPEVGGDACLYFPIADAGVCAERVKEVFLNGDTVMDMCVQAISRSRDMHALSAGVSHQISIYGKVLSSCCR